MKKDTILVVDDEELIRISLGKALKNVGYDVFEAESGMHAWSILKENVIDLVILDLIMPGMRGDELARQLHRIDPNLKVLYFTGYSDRLFIEQTAREEHEAFVDKPVTVNGLLEAVSLILFGHTHGP